MKRDSDIDIPKQNGFIVRYELLGIIGIMLIQTMAGIWWAATMTTEMTNVKTELVNIKRQMIADSNDRYRATDAGKDFAGVYKILDAHESRILLLERSSNGSKNGGLYDK